MWKILVLFAVVLAIQDTDGHWWRRRKYVHKSTVCEHQSLILNCGRHRFVKVHYATYGRQNKKTCARGSTSLCTTACRARNSTGVVKRFCNGKRRCRLRASNSLFGDPCVGTYKYLSVKYYCKKKKVYRSTVCEHHVAKLKCRGHKVIKVQYALYGRQNRKTCPTRRVSLRSTTCRARNSTRVARRICNGKTRCILRASNSVFGDPCIGTYKYLKVKYFCERRWHQLHGRDENDRDNIVIEDMKADEDVEN